MVLKKKKKSKHNYLPQEEKLNRDCCCPCLHYTLIWKNKTQIGKKKNQRTRLHIHLI